MPDETHLRERAHEVIRSGMLPSRPADRMVRRHGWSGLPCPVCIEPVKRDEVEVEIQFRRQDPTLGLECYQLHPVRCSKCSEPIALSDAIESSDGRLSHVDCMRPGALTPVERALVFLYCANHVVADCVPCNKSYRFTELSSEVLGTGGTNLCPRCRRDLTGNVRTHLFRCAMLPAEVRLRAHEVREAAQRLVKQSQQARDRSDVLIREAEAALFERQRDLREAMSRRAAS